MNVVPSPSWLFGSDGAGVHADQFFDESQPDSAALGRPGLRVLDAMETFEKPRHLRRRYPDSGIGHGHNRVRIVVPDPDGD